MVAVQVHAVADGADVGAGDDVHLVTMVSILYSSKHLKHRDVRHLHLLHETVHGVEGGEGPGVQVGGQRGELRPPAHQPRHLRQGQRGGPRHRLLAGPAGGWDSATDNLDDMAVCNT